MTATVYGTHYAFGFQSAASSVDSRFTTQPKTPNVTNQTTAPIMKCISAATTRPCTSCPSPGMKKLHTAAMTLPVEPCPAIKITPWRSYRASEHLYGGRGDVGR